MGKILQTKCQSDQRPLSRRCCSGRLRGFTLIELLVVIGIISMLMGLLLPSLQSARATARWVQCAANLKSVGQCLLMYANDNNGWLYPVGPEGMNGKPSTLGSNLAPNLRWPMHVKEFDITPPNPLPFDPATYTDSVPYDPVKFPVVPFTPKILFCPSDEDPAEGHSYVLNGHLADKRIKVASIDFGGLKSPEVVVMGEKKSDVRDYYMENTDFERVVEPYRHGVGRGSNYLFHDNHVDVLPPKTAKAGLDPWEVPVKTPAPKTAP